MKRILQFIGLGLLVASVMMIPACNSKGTITVASSTDTETGLLSQMIILMLRSKGFEVKDLSDQGDTTEVRNLMKEGKVDIYPDWTGDGADYFKDVPENVWKNRENGYQTVREKDKETNNFIWLEPAPANDIWAIAVTKNLAETEHLVTMEDFANYVNSGKDIKLAVSKTFTTDQGALPAYEKVYGFHLTGKQEDITAGANSWYTENEAAHNNIGVNAAMAYSTDGYLDSFNLTLLKDNKGAQNVFAPAPVVRGDVLEKYPEIKDILAPVFASLDDNTLRSLNSKTGFAGGEVNYLVARDYLINKGFLRGDPSGFPTTLPAFTANLQPPESQSKEILNTMMEVGPNSLVEKSFTVDQNEENARLVGWFMASGGAENDIRVLVLNDIDFINWNNLHSVEGLYKTDKLTTGKIDIPIPAGKYHLVFDNRFSEFSHKYILAKVYLYWPTNSNVASEVQK